MIVWGGVGVSGDHLNTGGRYCAQPATASAHRHPAERRRSLGCRAASTQIKWDGNLKHSDHLIIQYSRDGGASWFRIAQDIPAFTFRLLVASRQFPYHSGQGEDLVTGKSVDHRPERRKLHRAEAVEDTGWYLRSVRGPVTTAAKVRIRCYETSSVTDTSNAAFTLVFLKSLQ